MLQELDPGERGWYSYLRMFVNFISSSNSMNELWIEYEDYKKDRPFRFELLYNNQFWLIYHRGKVTFHKVNPGRNVADYIQVSFKYFRKDQWITYFKEQSKRLEPK